MPTVDSKTVPVARTDLNSPQSRELALHACTSHGPIQQGAMSTQNIQTRFKN